MKQEGVANAREPGGNASQGKQEVRDSIRADMENVKADMNLWKHAFEDKGREEYQKEQEKAKERLDKLERILYKI